MSKLKKELVENDDDFADLFNMNLFKELCDNICLDEESEDKYLSLEEFYFELTNTKNKKGLHPNFIRTLCLINEKKLYSFFDEDKMRNIFYSDTEESVMFINRMLKKITKNSKGLISCINMILNIQDEENEKMINFKAKLYLNILSRLIYRIKEDVSTLEKINTNEKEMTDFFGKHLDTKIEFDDLNENFKTIKSRIYYHYKDLAGNSIINKDGKVSKCISDKRAINIGKSIVSNKKFRNFLIKTLNNELTFQRSSYPYCISTTLSFLDIGDLTLLNELKKLLNKHNVYNVVKEEWFLEKHPTLVELLKDMDMKIAKEEQRYLNSMVNTDNKKKVNNRL